MPASPARARSERHDVPSKLSVYPALSDTVGILRMAEGKLPARCRRGSTQHRGPARLDLVTAGLVLWCCAVYRMDRKWSSVPQPAPGVLATVRVSTPLPHPTSRRVPLGRDPSPYRAPLSILPGAAIALKTADLEGTSWGVSFARPVGFEPTTSGLEIRCSIQLSYGRRCGVVFGTNGYLEQGLEEQQAMPSSRKVSRVAALGACGSAEWSPEWLGESLRDG